MIWRYKASRVVVNHDIVKDARFLERRIRRPALPMNEIIPACRDNSVVHMVQKLKD